MHSTLRRIRRCTAIASAFLALTAMPTLARGDTQADRDRGVEASRGPRSTGLSIGYEILEMAMNEFRYFAGEIAYRLDGRYRLRLTVMEVELTERHLSSGWEAAAIDGEGVSGYFRGYELHLQRFLWRGLYVSGAVGYYEDRYEDDATGQSVSNQTPTLGGGLGYEWREPFGVPYLYLDLAVPVRYYFNQIEEQQLGTATVRSHVVVSNIWLFIGATLPF